MTEEDLRRWAIEQAVALSVAGRIAGRTVLPTAERLLLWTALPSMTLREAAIKRMVEIEAVRHAAETQA